MQKDALDAVQQRNEANRSLLAILDLPTENGGSVRWPHNGVVWTRVGEDDWLPPGEDDIRRAAPSAHVAHKPFEVVRG
jgi:hypothetical protein